MSCAETVRSEHAVSPCVALLENSRLFPSVFQGIKDQQLLINKTSYMDRNYPRLIALTIHVP